MLDDMTRLMLRRLYARALRFDARPRKELERQKRMPKRFAIPRLE